MESSINEILTSSRSFHAADIMTQHTVDSTSKWQVMSRLWRMTCPTFLALLFQYSTSLVTFAFCGHLGQHDLASVGLAGSIILITGVAIFNGFGGASDALGAQAYGAKNYTKIGIIFHRGLLIVSLSALLIWAFWVNIDQFLLLIHQPPAVAKGTFTFLIVFSPGILGMLTYRLLRSYVQAQGDTKPNAITSFVCWILHVCYNYVLISCLHLGLVGAAVATGLTYFSLCLVLVLYMRISKQFGDSWRKPTVQCLLDWREFLVLGLSGVVGELSLFIGGEASIFIMGLISQADIAAQAVLFQLRSTLMMLSVGFLVSLTVMIGNDLGAGEPRRARMVAKLGVLTSAIINFLIALVVFLCRGFIGRVFTTDPAVNQRISEAIPVMCAAFFCSSLNCTMIGILLSCTKQLVFAILFFVGQFVVALPLGSVLVFVCHLGIVGMWAGMASGAFLQFFFSIIYIFRFIDFEKESENARRAQAESNVDTAVTSPGENDDDPDDDTPMTKSEPYTTVHYGTFDNTQDDERTALVVHVEDARSSVSGSEVKRAVMKRVLTFLVVIIPLLISIGVRCYRDS